MTPSETPARSVRRVVFSGGPAAGKTATLDVIARHLPEAVVALPEAATILFRGGFPRPKNAAGRRLVQHTVFTLQRNCEEIFALQHPDRLQVCDRGSLDGAAYWPGGLERFLGAMQTTLDTELRRYDAVIFLETSAYDLEAYPTASPYRTETPVQARKLDAALQDVWRHHPNFHRIGYSKKFYEKVAAALIALHRAMGVGERVARDADQPERA